MVASVNTVGQLIKVVREHVDEETFGRILSKLEQLQGNKSFKDTIQRIKLENEKLD